MKVFVSGGGGFLGKHLVSYLKKQGCVVIAPNSKECDLLKPTSLNDYTTESFDAIFHLAAWTQAGDFCLRHPGDQWVMNQQINTSMLSWWATKQPQAKLITIGTSCCYEPGSPHSEDHYLQGQPIESLFTYGMTKRMLLIGQRALEKQYGLKHLTLVPSTLYGSSYHLDGRQMHFIFDLMRKIVDYKRSGTPVVLWGDGYQTRELIHVRDFIETAWKLVNLVENEVINVGSGEAITIRECASQLAHLVGVPEDIIQYDEDRYVGAKNKVLKIEKLKRLLPDFSITPLNVGLAEIVEWYQGAH